MTVWGLTAAQISLLKKLCAKSFFECNDARIYIFGSRATGKFKQYSDIDLVVRSKDESLAERIAKLRSDFDDSNLPIKVDIMAWGDLPKEYLSGIQRDKKLFWTPKDIEVLSPWRSCPIGQHWVKRHDRHLRTGTLVDRDGHCRRSPKGKDLLSGDEIRYFPEQELFLRASVKASPITLNFPNGTEFDALINGWTAYWNHVFKPSDPLHPNHVKALIATESGFKPTAINRTNPKKIGPARGLLQITEATARALKPSSKELRNHFVQTGSYDDLFDPNRNICAAIRWLFRKKETAERRLRRAPSWPEVIMEYKGRLGSKTKETERIRNELEKYVSDLFGSR